MTKVLLTGGSGFIAAHILDQLLAAGHSVVTTVRSEAKAAKIREAYPSQAASGDLVVAIVPELARADAFDELIKQTPGLEVVLHTASPFHFNFTDPQTALVDPAVTGTTSILHAIAKHAPAVRRVVVTSSFAAILDEAAATSPATVFSEASWNPVTPADIHRSPATAYRLSKKLAEQAAWDFVRDQGDKIRFDLVTINPPMVFGPLAHPEHVGGLDGVNTSNQRIANLLRGGWKQEGGVPEVGVAWIWVDVRDVAAAHVKAGLEVPEAGGKRLFVTAGTYSNAELARIVRKRFPEHAELVPGEEALAAGEMPPEERRYRYDNSATNQLLGIRYRSLEESIVDTVKSLKKIGA
ncbi:hypothetical protein VTJ83DRAFT_6397 [Remersonia thermophila]|uniref:NAD-dependent epimerase/dehydratase domain-containing protein n=1 Tax=Remersonia thermophila TaxID=72144 RepID=A0ABR4D4K0_9PEZI